MDTPAYYNIMCKHIILDLQRVTHKAIWILKVSHFNLLFFLLNNIYNWSALFASWQALGFVITLNYIYCFLELMFLYIRNISVLVTQDGVF